MRVALTALVFATVACAAAPTGAAPAQSSSLAQNPPNETIQCIDVGGQSVPPVCRAPASRLDKREDICLCANRGMPVKVAVCGKDQKPPAESLRLNSVRRTAARDGSLIGDVVDGQPICAAPRNP